MSPITRIDILAGKSLPYVALMLAVDLGYCLATASGANSLKMLYLFSVLSLTLTAFATFTVLASRSYREVTFMGSLSLLSFLLFIVFPNVFSGVNLLAFVSPLDTVTSLQNGADVGFPDVFLSLLPYKFLFAFFFTASVVCFGPETFQNTPGISGLMRIFYVNLRKIVGHDLGFVAAAVCLLVPFVYIVQTLIAYLIIPMGLLAPYASILLLALIEEVTKILPYYFVRNMRPWAYGLASGATFFLTEKVFNIYLISKVYSYLPAPYTIFIVKGLFWTLVLHIAATTILAYVLSRSKRGRYLALGLAVTTCLHYGYNVYMMGGGLIR